jgi:hypothetical protein
MRKDLEGKAHGLIEVLSWHLCGQTEENHEISLRISGVPFEI